MPDLLGKPQRSRARWPWLAICVVLTLPGCGAKNTPEGQIEQTMAQMEQAAEGGDVRGFMRHVSVDFGGSDGLDHDAMRLLLRSQLSAHTRIRAIRSDTRIEVHDGSASARMNLLLLGGVRWIPDSGERLDVRTGWRKEGGDWKLLSAEYEAGQP